jgi:AcrR family transcriptional regulator
VSKNVTELPGSSASGRAGHSDDGARDADDQDDPRIVRTRHAVHEAGRELLVESGPASVTHAAIASAARLSRTTLYKHWPTRSDLLVEICRAAKPHSAIRPCGDVRSDLVQLISDAAENLGDRESRKMFASMVAQSQWDDEAREAQAALIGVGMADLAAVLRAGVESGALRPGIEPTSAAGRLLGPLFFAALVTDVDVTSDEVEAIVDDFVATNAPR